MKGIVCNNKIMIIANINSQTWPQTKWVISMSIFQVVVIILFCVFVRYDSSLDAKLADPKATLEYDSYPCKYVLSNTFSIMKGMKISNCIAKNNFLLKLFDQF